MESLHLLLIQTLDSRYSSTCTVEPDLADIPEIYNNVDTLHDLECISVIYCIADNWGALNLAKWFSIGFKFGDLNTYYSHTFIWQVFNLMIISNSPNFHDIKNITKVSYHNMVHTIRICPNSATLLFHIAHTWLGPTVIHQYISAS